MSSSTRSRANQGFNVCKISMKRSRAHKSYPTWRQREARMFLLAMIAGAFAAAVFGVLVYFGNRMAKF